MRGSSPMRARNFIHAYVKKSAAAITKIYSPSQRVSRPKSVKERGQQHSSAHIECHFREGQPESDDTEHENRRERPSLASLVLLSESGGDGAEEEKED